MRGLLKVSNLRSGYCLPRYGRHSLRVQAGRGFAELLKLREERSREGREPLKQGVVSPMLSVPSHIPRPSYADSGVLPEFSRDPEIHDAEGIERMRKSGKLAAQVLDFAVSLVTPGISTDSIDVRVHQMIIDAGAYPSPLNYGRFPKSVCTSINECVCHGIPDSRILQDGDLLNIDVTVYLNGHHGDTSRMVFVGRPPFTPQGGIDVHLGKPKDGAEALVKANKKALEAAIAICAPGVPYSRIGHTIADVAEETGYRIVKDFVGHGVGQRFHAYPYIFHHRNREPGFMQLHQTFTIEPIFTMGKPGHRQWNDGWSEIAVDGALSAQCEHTLLITDNGCDVLTVSD